MEHYTYTAKRIIDDVREKFGDTGGVQITPAMILRWINDGARELAAMHDFVVGTADTDLLSGYGTYDLNVLMQQARIKQIETITIDGRPLQMVQLAELMRQIEGADSGRANGTPQVGALRGGSLTLWPKPDKNIPAGIMIYYTGWPLDVTTAESKLKVPDRLYNALVAYVHAQALKLDENLEAAQLALAEADSASRREFEKERLSPTDFYPTITAYDED